MTYSHLLGESRGSMARVQKQQFVSEHISWGSGSVMFLWGTTPGYYTVTVKHRSLQLKLLNYLYFLSDMSLFYFVYFGALLLGAYTFMFFFFFKKLILFHYEMSLIISRNILCPKAHFPVKFLAASALAWNQKLTLSWQSSLMHFPYLCPTKSTIYCWQSCGALHPPRRYWMETDSSCGSELLLKN